MAPALVLQNVLADVRRGVWRAPHPEPAPPPVADPTFHEFASEWWAAKRDELSRKTQIDYEWQLSNHLLPFFARHRLTQITVAEVDRYRFRLCASSSPRASPGAPTPGRTRSCSPRAAGSVRAATTSATACSSRRSILPTSGGPRLA